MYDYIPDKSSSDSQKGLFALWCKFVICWICCGVLLFFAGRVLFAKMGYNLAGFEEQVLLETLSVGGGLAAAIVYTVYQLTRS